jgi:XTP/dITP diphosphohydrolase
MGALTHESLVEYLLEEAFEVAETIETGAAEAELQSELGDVLLQVVLHARLAQEREVFDFDDVARGITEKMIRRNPHVFRPDGTLQDTFPATVAEIVQKWDAVKRAERPADSSVFEGIPITLPALARAQKSLDRAERAGWTAPAGPLKLPDLSSLALNSPVLDSQAAESGEYSEKELGELLFGLVAAARVQGLDAERALRGALREFQEGHGSPS